MSLCTRGREHYDELTMAWRDVIGPIHHDDEEV